MDPLSQGVLGAVLPQSFIKSKKHILYATVIGFLGGMAPDLDVLIRSSKDPMLFLEFHRQFTHSLFFIPIGGMICSFIFYKLWTKKELSFKETYLYTTLGYATHALLDGCTSYGTQLLWPFTNNRFGWNTISIIDPLFTLPLLGLMLIALFKKSKNIARLALLYILLYMSVGLIQNNRATKIAYNEAERLGHTITKIQVKPTFANQLLWKVIYESNNEFYVFAVRLGVESKIYLGGRVKKVIPEEDLLYLGDTQSFKDAKRFEWFSQGFLAFHPEDKNIVIDARYSTLPNKVDPLWGIEFSKNYNEHVKYKTFRGNMKSRMSELIDMVIGK